MIKEIDQKEKTKEEIQNTNEVTQKTGEIVQLSPKLDVIFQALFGEIGSEKITKKFVSEIINEKITSIDLNQNPMLRREKKDDKQGVLDILAKLNGKENCNIEIQLIDQDNIIERILYYWSKLYARQIKKGNDYARLERTIVILIADFTVKGLEDLEYHTEWRIIEEKYRKKILTDKLELHIISLEEAKKTESQEELMDWVCFLNNPKSERVKKKMEKNEELKEAVEKLNEISQDEYMQRLADAREKEIMDIKAVRSKGIADGIEQGKKEGMREGIKEGIKEGMKEGMKEGIKEGMKEGMKEGIKEGIEKGIIKNKIETAKKMIEKGIEVDTIIEITHLSKEEISKIKNQV